MMAKCVSCGAVMPRGFCLMCISTQPIDTLGRDADVAKAENAKARNWARLALISVPLAALGWIVAAVLAIRILW